MKRSFDSDLLEYYKDLSLQFQNKISDREFIDRIIKLENAIRDSFSNACEIYNQSQKCVLCEPNVAMVLLCTSIEVVSQKRRTVPFRQWLIDYKLDELKFNSDVDIKKKINKFYEEYLNHPEREGFSYNFKQFILENIPKYMETAPIKISKNKVLLQASLEEAIDCIYSKFRSMYVHKGIKNIIDIPEHLININKHMLLLLHKNKYYHIEFSNLVTWFSNVVRESLLSYLIKNTKLNFD